MKYGIPESLARELESRMGFQIMGTQSLSGGCIHQARRLDTDSGPFFLKYNSPDQRHNLETESKGLDLLATANALTVPTVQACGSTDTHAYLLMDFVDPGRKGKNFWENFGQGLANLHLNTRPEFGLDFDNYIGALPQSNRAHGSWLEFFGEERIKPMLRMAVDTGKMDRTSIQACESILGRLKGYFPEEAPALVHGDLWGGNFLVNMAGQVVLIDPSVYYGHREMELAFMHLFDSHPSVFYDSYHSVFPLEKGWQSRLDLYNLYPLLVHVNLFGGGYTRSVMSIVERYK